MAKLIMNLISLPGLSLLSLLGTTAQAQSQVDDATLEMITPIYAEVCAGSRYREIENQAADGGAYGHAVLFLKGACRDHSLPYPALTAKGCEAGPGVGVSTYFGFKNVAWVATEGKDFFFNGNLPANAPLTKDTVESAIKTAQRMGILKNVEMHDWIMNGRPKEENAEHFKYRMSLGTDWALTYARNMECVRIPLNRTTMKNVIEHLNTLNEKYYTSSTPYKWNMLKNNCSHTVHNALAAAYAWPEKATDQPTMHVVVKSIVGVFSPFRRASAELAVPFNVVIDAAEKAFQKVPSFRGAMADRDKLVPASLWSATWALPQAGSLLLTYPIHSYQNRYFKTEIELSALERIKADGPMTEAEREALLEQTRAAKFKTMQQNPIYSDLKTQLQWRLVEFKAALDKAKRSPDESHPWWPKYIDYLERQVQTAEQGIAQIEVR